jgi:hypothetical protein
MKMLMPRGIQPSWLVMFRAAPDGLLESDAKQDNSNERRITPSSLSGEYFSKQSSAVKLWPV